MFFLSATIYQTAAAGVSPVIVSSEIINDTWFPLPLEQMKDAAVDTALTRISETGNFAFLFDSKGAKQKHTGSLKLKVTLVEPAESAKITIKLTLPNQGGTFVASSSTSLSNKNHKGIFNALENLGRDGADQIFLATEDLSMDSNISQDEIELRRHIIDLNKKIIDLNYSIKKIKISTHNTKVEEKLALLSSINEKLDKNLAYAKKADIQKNKKLDAIYSEIQKLNIGSNTDSAPPRSDQLTEFDATQLPQLTKANDLKYKKKFTRARKALKTILSDYKISPMLRAVVKEEMNINLPIYEAGIASNNLPKFFSADTQHNNVNLKQKIKYINNLYDFVLAQPDLSFRKRSEINDKKSKINLMGEEMGTVITMLSMASKRNFSVALRSLMNKHSVGLAMGFKGTGRGQCPNKESIEKEMKIIKFHADIVAYKDLTDSKCSLTVQLRDPSKQKITYTFDERTAEYN